MTTTEMTRVRHDAPIEVTIKTGRKVLSREVMEASLVGAHLTVQSYIHGGISGRVNWHDRNGPLPAAPKVHLRLTDPSYALQEGQECNCKECCDVRM
jgi:hypothetical protein